MACRHVSLITSIEDAARIVQVVRRTVRAPCDRAEPVGPVIYSV